MDKTNITKGQVIKNYKVLCEILGHKVKAGKSKILHMKDLERYFKFHFDKQKIIIDEVYDTPKEKVDGRITNGKSKYDNLMDNIITNRVLTYNTIEASKNDLFKNYIELFTPQYNDLFLDTEGFAESNKLGIGITNEYLSKLNNIVMNCTTSALNRLQKKGVIKWSLDMFIKDNPEEYYADPELFQLLKVKEKLAYEEMQIKPFARANISINKKFKRLVCDFINEDINRSIYNYWKVYNISLIKEDIEEQIEDIEELKKRLSISICESVKNRKMFNKEVGIFYPYVADKYKEQLEKLNQLVFGVNEIINIKDNTNIINIENYLNIENENNNEDMFYENEEMFPF
ncbi:hypothetical protein [Pseudobacteroides cellulosolvens]|uniref:Uncharacterized protein n=1 Tax=Pseudobacteroides cellulosolvens ATCC 35603 = DSM 2933 TaxID=398512 RepID=A0A0L6JGY0_9FIRM|nr:hypothetical protein [Pseudobacteroides cellulosolvens]KNY24979.1 hypothetical protein Bccel_0236 [Pseudobacteroides cellulosolvens ATCC 35603 = DSM 2933]